VLSVFLTWLIIVWGAAACIYMLWGAWSRFPRRDFDDVVHYLYPVDLSLAEALLDPSAEFEFSWKLSPEEFRDAQRRRMSLYVELVSRMAHNSKVLVEFSHSEIMRNDPRSADRARALQQRAIEVRLYAMLTLLKLHFWMWVCSRAMGKPPTLPQLRKTAQVDGLRTYDALKNAAAAAFIHLQPCDLATLTKNL
jgi:hypothetical protein